MASQNMPTIEPTVLKPSPPGTGVRAAISAYIGTVIEWYDFFIYGTASALVFNVIFFSDLDPWVGTIAAFGTLATGFIARPLGGIIAGHFGDKYGRKKMLIVTLILMGVSTLVVGILPSSEAIGWLAPVLLVIARIVQGLAAGGEWGGGLLMTIEHFSPKHRGFWGSIGLLGVPSALALSTGTFALLGALMSPEDLISWGWRLPFIASVLLIFVGLWIRSGVTESPEFQEHLEAAAAEKKKHFPLAEVLRNDWKSVLMGVAIAIGPFVPQAIFSSFAIAYAPTVGFETSQILSMQTLANILCIVVIPLAGAISDKIGRKTMYSIGGVGLAIASVTLFLAFDSGSASLLTWAFIFIFVSQASMYGPMGAFLAELFSTGNRYTGASLGYQAAGVLGGGLSPLIASTLIASGMTELPWIPVAGYMVIAVILGIVGALAAPNMTGKAMRK